MLAIAIDWCHCFAFMLCCIFDPNRHSLQTKWSSATHIHQRHANANIYCDENRQWRRQRRWWRNKKSHTRTLWTRWYICRLKRNKLPLKKTRSCVQSGTFLSENLFNIHLKQYFKFKGVYVVEACALSFDIIKLQNRWKPLTECISSYWKLLSLFLCLLLLLLFLLKWL